MPDQTSQSLRDIIAPAVWAMLLVGLVPLVGAQFGSGNQVEQFSLIARQLDPNFALGDHYINNSEIFSPRMYYVAVVALFASILPLPLVMAAIGVLSNMALFAVTYATARRFFGITETLAVIAGAVVITNSSLSLGLAGFLRFDSIQPANPAIPLALWGWFLLASRKPYLGAGLLLASALMHPLIGIEIGLFAFGGAGLVTLFLIARATRPLGDLIHMFAAGLIFAIGIYVMWLLPQSRANSDAITDAQFFDILIHFRAPHHYLSADFYGRAWREALLFLAGMVIALGFLGKSTLGRLSPFVIGALLAVFAMALSLWLVDIAQNRTYASMQIFRMVMVPKWVGILILCGAISARLNRQPLQALALGATLILATSAAQAYMVWVLIAGIVCLSIVEKLFKNKSLSATIEWVGITGMIGLSILLHIKYGLDIDLARGLLAIAMILALIALKRFGSMAPLAAAAILGATLSITTLARENGAFGIDGLKAEFTWADIENDQTDIAKAAKDLSPAGSIWIVPSDLEVFRLLSERAVVVDFISIPFNDQALLGWRDRLATQYGPIAGRGHGANREMTERHKDRLNMAATVEKFNATHAVLFQDTPWDGEILYQNDTYKAVSLLDSATNN